MIPLFEVIDPEDAVKRSTASMFERALYAYCLGALDEAEKGFLEVLSHAPEDKARGLLPQTRAAPHRGGDPCGSRAAIQNSYEKPHN